MTSNPVKEEVVTDEMIDNATPDQIARANAAVAVNMVGEGEPKYGSAQGYACALTAVIQSDLAMRQADPRTAELEAALEKIAGGHIPADASRCIPGNWQPAFGALQDIARATLNRKDKP